MLLDFIIIAVISTIVWSIVYAVKGESFWRYAAWALFSAYLVWVAYITIFPIHINSSIQKAFEAQGWKIVDCIVLVPFRDGISKDDVLNVIMAIPFGFLLPFVKKKTTWKTALIAGLIFGTTIELLQLLIAAIQGFSFRYTDVSDVICNLVGTLIGWIMAAALILLVQKRKATDGSEQSFYSYIAQRRVK